MDIFFDRGVKGAAIKVYFKLDDQVTDIYLEEIRYFSDYNQTRQTEITDEGKLRSLKSLQDELYKYALPKIRQIITKEAVAVKLQRIYGSFTYSIYDNPCRETIYFAPKFIDPDETELMREAEAHHVERVDELLKRVNGVNLRDQYGRTALVHATTSRQSSSTVAALLAAGADVNVPDLRGTTALMNASQLGELKSVQLLLSHGANSSLRNNVGETALMLAAGANRSGVPIVRSLLDSGALVNTQDANGKTALMIAARGGNLDIVEDLLRAGANPKISDKRGNTAVEYARYPIVEVPARQGAIIRLLIDASGRE